MTRDRIKGLVTSAVLSAATVVALASTVGAGVKWG